MTTSLNRQLPKHLVMNERPLRVLLIGAGGNGSEVYEGLVRLHQAMIALGGSGLYVTVIDDDEVSESNCVRQRFWPHEIGMPKAVALVQRSNLLTGTDWDGKQMRYNGEAINQGCDLIITAVDNLETRKAVAKITNLNALWLDMGCDRDKGQVVLGQLREKALNDYWPNVAALFPEMLEREDDNRPSCSTADSLSRQDLMINQTTAGAAINLLWKMLRTGEVAYNGVMIDLAEGTQRPIPFFPVSEKA